jgi:RNA polymerase sigma factor (sigma-70 family)
MRTSRQVYEELLVIRARTGERAAFADLAALRGARLLVHATRLLNDRDAARDVVQEAWIDILRGLPGLRDARAFPAWATRIVTRRCASHVKRRVTARNLARDVAIAVPDHAENAGPQAADARSVRAAIADLPPDQAATVALFYMEDMSVAEVSIALDIPRGTVKTRLMHARKKLKQALKGENDG